MRWCLLLLCLATLALYGSVALAQASFPPLDGVVADNTGRFDKTAINDAAKTLQEKGAFVLVLTVSDTGGYSSSDAYLDAALIHYGLAQPDGQVNAELVAFFVSFAPRYLAIHYGDRFLPALERRVSNTETAADRIRTTRMNPQLSAGNYTTAITTAISATVQELESGPGVEPGPSTSPQNRGISVIGWMLLSMVGVFVVALLILFAGPKVLKGLQEARAARRRWQELLAAIAQVRARVNELLVNLDLPPQPERHLAFAFLAQYYGPDTPEGQEFAQLYQKAYELFNSATTAYTEQTRLWGTAERKADEETLRKRKETYEGIAGQLEEATGLIQRLEQAAQRVQRASDALDQAKSTVSELRATYEQAAGQVRLPEGSDAFSQVERLLSQAQERLPQDPLRASDLTDQALAKAREQATEAQESVKLWQSNQMKLQELPNLTPRAEAYIEDGREAFQQISQYNSACWKDIAGNGSEAERSLSAARGLLQSAAEKNSPGLHQEVRQAAEDIRGSQEAIEHSQQLIRAIIERLENLRVYEATVQREVESAQLAIEQGKYFIQQHDPEVSEEREQELARAEGLVERAGKELEAPQPNWLLLADLTRGASRLADKALAEARDEQAAMERRRQRVLAAKAEARAAISRAENYIQARETFISRSAKDLLAGARRFSQQGEQLETEAARLEEEALVQALEQAASLFEDAKKRADQAYEKARRDNDANRPPPVIFGGYSGGGYSGGGYSGGGYSGGGGFSGGGFGGGGHSGGGFGGGGRSGGGW